MSEENIHTFDEVMVLATEHQVKRVRLRRLSLFACFHSPNSGQTEVTRCAKNFAEISTRGSKECARGLELPLTTADFWHRKNWTRVDPTLDWCHRLDHNPPCVLLPVWMRDCHVWFHPLSSQHSDIDLRPVLTGYPPLYTFEVMLL